MDSCLFYLSTIFLVSLSEPAVRQLIKSLSFSCERSLWKWLWSTFTSSHVSVTKVLSHTTVLVWCCCLSSREGLFIPLWVNILSRVLSGIEVCLSLSRKSWFCICKIIVRSKGLDNKQHFGVFGYQAGQRRVSLFRETTAWLTLVSGIVLNYICSETSPLDIDSFLELRYTCSRFNTVFWITVMMSNWQAGQRKQLPDNSK
jgi:hypothetical protein